MPQTLATEGKLIADAAAIKRKIERMAVEIYEHNFESGEVILAGIASEGFDLACALQLELHQQFGVDYKLLRLSLDKTSPSQPEVKADASLSLVNGKSVVLVDDVLNSGRTLLYATVPLMYERPAKLEVAVMVARSHRSFPIKAKYVGLALATTVQEHVKVTAENGQLNGVYLR